MSAPLPDEVRLVLPAGLTAVSGAAMATDFVFHLGGHEPDYLRQAATEALREIERLESTLSFYQEGSDVTRINRAAAGSEVHVSPDTMACLVQAAEVTQLTRGAFDAFTGRAAAEAKNQQVPPHLRDAPSPTGTETPGPVIALEPGESVVRKLRAGPWLDLGAIGKGYGLDVVAALLREWDITVGLLTAGGSSHRGLGGEGWILETAAGVRRKLPGEFCLGASGGRFQAGHIIDARATGPGTGTTRALALARSAALADALSTAAMLLTPVEITELARALPGTAFLLVNASGHAWGSGAPFA